MALVSLPNTKISYWLAILAFIGFYLFLHVTNLTKLPVFADEAIYIRWAQLIIDDGPRYAFFPLNDGKTPLHMWFLVPFQYLFTDQLFAGRFVSVLVGLAQALLLGATALLLRNTRRVQFLTMLAVLILPYWYFHHRMALIDGMLSLWLTLLLFSLLKLVTNKQFFSWNISLGQSIWILFGGVAFGLGLWTKLPSLLFTPTFGIVLLLPSKLAISKRAIGASKLAVSYGIGIVVFLLLKLHPAFGQLFARGGDFLYGLDELQTLNLVEHMGKNAWLFLSYFSRYLTIPVLLACLAGLYSQKTRRVVAVLLLCAVSFVLPILLMGKVVYPRYLLPASVFLTLAAAITTDTLMYRIQSRKLSYKQLFAALAIIVGSMNTLRFSSEFIYTSQFMTNAIPFAPIDSIQYLEEWSSGNGIVAATAYVQNRAQQSTVLVGTEGFFGTLPDGMLLYMHRRSVKNLFVEGIGQPIYELPSWFVAKSANYSEVYLVANSHRMFLPLDRSKLVAQYCRLEKSPCLQLWNISEYAKSERQRLGISR